MAKSRPEPSRGGREGGLTPAQVQAARERAARRRALATAALCYLLVLLLLGLGDPVVVGLLVSGDPLHPYPDEIGMTPDAEIKTPVEITVPDLEAIALREREIEQYSPEIWLVELDRDSKALQGLNAFVDLLNKNEPQTSAQIDAFVSNVMDQLGIALDPAAAGELMPRRLRSLANPLTIDQLQLQIRLILDEILNVRFVVSNLGFYESHLASKRMVLRDEHGIEHTNRPNAVGLLVWPEGVRAYLTNEALPRFLPGGDREGLRQAAAGLIMQLIREPNLAYSKEQTENRRRQLIANLGKNPINRTYQKGDTVAEAGKPLSAVQANAVALVNQKSREMMVTKLAGKVLFSASVFLMLALFLSRFRGGFQTTPGGVALYALPVLLALAIGLGAQKLWNDPGMTMACFPAAMVGLLGSILIRSRAGLVLVLVSAALFGLVNGQGIEFMILALFAGSFTVLTCRRLRERADMIHVAWKVAIVNVLTLVIFMLVRGDLNPDPLQLSLALANPPICVMITVVILWFIEEFFGIITDWKLLELTGLHHELIVQLEEKAPGTYQHVLNVTKLAEAAANSIGANYLLVRAGALFHDIGKMVKPKYFSENQITLEDKRAHSKLSPYMSVLIIKNHVKEGVELARRFKLPKRIVDFIPEHHGTGLIRFFYNAAQRRYEESATAEPVREEDFRYPGPKPQSIETAIVLLADSVEAIAASKFTGGQVSEDEIRRVTQMAINERFNDGQFDECDLTMRHLREMREAFVRTLLARYHFRVAYPTLTKGSAAAQAPRAELTGSIAVAGPATRGEAAG